MKSKYTYRCLFPGCKKKAVTAFQFSDYPQCNGDHDKIMDFIEVESTGIPQHILESKQKSTTREARKVNGGNWIRD